MFRVMTKPTINGCLEMVFFCPACNQLHTYYKVANDCLGGTCPVICKGCQEILPVTNCILDHEDLGAFHKLTYHHRASP